ncbi:MAG: hypothetical protein DHS20C21_11200 [Gemmatimonadota bacterium]|nr:MAG: hypothetical protein DHS20C21_11200 [Gemmatimonadota bacterium]
MRNPWISIACGLLAASAAPAETLMGSHVGSADPGTEGWTLDLAGVGATSGPLNDGGTPVWFVEDTSTEINSALWYRWQLAPDDLTTALSSGWRVRTELRAANSSGGGESQFFGFLTGSVAFQAHFRAETNGDLTVRLVEGFPPFSGPTYVVAGGALTYHSYELISDGISGTASLWIDGIETHTGYDGLAFGGTNGARFGCGTSGATGTVYVKSVDVWIADSVPVSVSPSFETAGWGELKARFK